MSATSWVGPLYSFEGLNTSPQVWKHRIHPRFIITNNNIIYNHIITLKLKCAIMYAFKLAPIAHVISRLFLCLCCWSSYLIFLINQGILLAKHYTWQKNIVIFLIKSLHCIHYRNKACSELWSRKKEYWSLTLVCNGNAHGNICRITACNGSCIKNFKTPKNSQVLVWVREIID